MTSGRIEGDLPPSQLCFDEQAEQFRLVRLQTYNWGTFADLCDVAIPESGYLFVGPSGSGKSTLLDAHAALLTPPKWVGFNVAAREAERGARDRSLMTYVRGAWKQQTGEAGEHAIQYLRTGTTWSAIAETYRNGHGAIVVLAQVLWVRGNVSGSSSVQRRYLVLQRNFDIRELSDFAAGNFDVRRLKKQLMAPADGTSLAAFVGEEFSAYQERFRRLLGIDSERALRLLHKTQSAKNLGALDVFLRDFMLDVPETFATAERLVGEFGELDAAHKAVVAARRQIDVLSPARVAHGERRAAGERRDRLEDTAGAVDAYGEQRRATLLRQRVDALAIEVEGARQEALRLSSIAEQEFRKLSDLKAERNGMSAALAPLRQELEGALAERPGRVERRDRAAAACRLLGWPMPTDAPAFQRIVGRAREHLGRDRALREQLEERRDALKAEHGSAEREFKEVVTEVTAMERQPSNIPAHMLEIRARLAEGTGIPESRLSFGGELIEVRADAGAWRGAIERVLHNFALSLLVHERDYGAVSSYVNGHHLGRRLVYLRMLPHERETRGPGPSSLVRKLELARVPEAAWLREELAQRFDYTCADSVQAFRNATRALTESGQVKHSHARHEKDDRHRIDDPRRWVLGFENSEKLALYKARAQQLAQMLSSLQAQLDSARKEANSQREALLHAQTLANLTWSEVDVASLVLRIEHLQKRIEDETRARPALAELDLQIESQQATHERAAGASNAQEVRRQGLDRERGRHEQTLGSLSQVLLSASLSPAQRADLDERFESSTRPCTLETLDRLTVEVDRAIGLELKRCEVRMGELRAEIERKFTEFNRNWPAESGGLDATLAAAEDYFEKLTRLETDGLPRYEQRFLRLLREQSDQNLTLLATRLDLERKAIRDRLELVNESLRTAPFNPGTHLVIEPLDLALEEVRQFKHSLKGALSQSFSVEPDVAEQRFLVLRELVARLSSQETVDKSWRNLVLDVRRHVEFVARELDEYDQEVEVYRSGAGKSGGQRQKLAATCLAAALRYQLGGQDRGLPVFATVVLDEAFDKADAEFTAMAMNIFKTFGFQMVVATPLKSVMTLEPFIGGACYVHIHDRRDSRVLAIDYDEEARRLRLPEQVRDGQEAALS